MAKNKKKTNKKVKVKKSNKKGAPSKGGIIPLGDRVLVRPMSIEETNKRETFGIIIPDTVSKEMPEQGEVLAVGPGKFEDGKRVPVSVKKGDRVVFSKYAYEEVKIGEEKYYILKEENILAVINN